MSSVIFFQSTTAVEGWDSVKEEGIMFTCQLDLDPRKPHSVLMYWVIGYVTLFVHSKAVVYRQTCIKFAEISK